ncbi:PilW family protein [Pseudomonas sp. UBA2684]|uniref:PilW family protein n=1 Tax=Pseudomonas sp. UBA2684 TaxID=1947311 RepID=UPI0025F8B3B3|nr:PilW family protein [Pseudomonas sp. UBA2684]|tara:strand:- start:19958 stop:20977 length:1020 start_codon:yes stop_codon:yes gene_type:complete
MIKQRGLSLVELMVAMLIGLIITGAVIQVFISNKTTFLMQDGMSRVQENGRFALQYLALEIRPAGVGVGVRLPEESICQVAESDMVENVSMAISGYTAGTTDTTAVPGTDVVNVTTTDNCGAWLAESESFKPSINNANFKANMYCSGMKKGQALMLMDIEKAVIIEVNNSPSAGSAEPTINHSGANNVGAECGGFKFSDMVFDSTARVVSLSNRSYFVRYTGRDDAQGNPINALAVRYNLSEDAGPYDIVDGVENMQVRYGMLDASGVGVDEYLSAAAIEAANRWGDVQTVRIDLLLTSDAQTPGAQQQSITFNGTAVAADGRFRQIYSTVIALRNRIE